MAAIPEFIAGDLALDFHNTVSWDIDSPRADTGITSYDTLLDWLARAGALSQRTAAAFVERGAGSASQPTRALQRAYALRSTIHHLFAPVARGGNPAPHTLLDLNACIEELRMRLGPVGNGYDWEWSADAGSLESALWPVVWAAAELLRSADLHRVGECAADDCRWLFVDRSRRGNRKWCDMRECGNRAKVRRHYRRHARS